MAVDTKLKNEIASARRDPFEPVYNNLMMPSDDTLMTRGNGKGLKIYDEIERDCHAYAVLQKRKMAVVAREWGIEPASNRMRDRKAADMVKAQLSGIGFDQVCLNLLDAILKGYSVGEPMWDVVGSELVVNAVLPRAQRRFVFDTDYRPRLITQQNMLRGEELPPRKFVVHRCGAKDGNPYGLGLGTRLFWPVWFKRQGIQFWLTFADKFGSPTAVGKYPTGSSIEDQDKLLAALRAMSRESAITFPQGMEADLLEAARSGSVDTYEKLCRYMDEEISKAVLGETLSTSMGQNGARAASETHNSVRLELVKADADLLANTLNQSLVRWIVELNMPDATPPRLWWDCSEPEDLKTRAERDKTIVDMGVGRPTLKYIQDTYGGEWEAIPSQPPATQPGSAALPAVDGASFAEAATPLDQAVIDTVNLDDQLQAVTEVLLQPLLDEVRNGVAPEALLNRLAELYPTLDDTALTDLLARVIFVSDLYGRAMAEQSNG